MTHFQLVWNIANSKELFSPNLLGNAVVPGDEKIDFFAAIADWINVWEAFSTFSLSTQTSSALIKTLRAQALLISELLREGLYTYM